MATVLTPPEVTTGRNGGNGTGGYRDLGGGGYGGHWPPLPAATYRLGMTLGLAGISMLFIALTSAFIVRQGLGGEWQPIEMPPILLWNTAILLASSVALEIGRRSLAGDASGLRIWLRVSVVLGLVFLAGQIVAWRQLVAQGVYLNGGAYGSFFYTLTGAHGAHAAGGLVALALLTVRAGGRSLSRARLSRWVGVTSIYWHFMGGLWVYLLVLLFVWR